MTDLNSQEIGKLIKVVFQDYFQYELTIRENVGFGNLNELHHDSKLNNALDMVDLSEIKSRGLDQQLGK